MVERVRALVLVSHPLLGDRFVWFVPYVLAISGKLAR
jgi:hypothetical protein